MEPKHWLTKSLMNKKTWPSYLLSWGVLPYPSLPEWKEKIFLLSVSMEQNGDKLNTKWRCYLMMLACWCLKDDWITGSVTPASLLTIQGLNKKKLTWKWNPNTDWLKALWTKKNMTILPAVLAASASDGRIEQEKVDMKMKPKHWLTKNVESSASERIKCSASERITIQCVRAQISK